MHGEPRVALPPPPSLRARERRERVVDVVFTAAAVVVAAVVVARTAISRPSNTRPVALPCRPPLIRCQARPLIRRCRSAVACHCRTADTGGGAPRRECEEERAAQPDLRRHEA